MWSVLAVPHVTDGPGKHWVGSHETFLPTWTARMSTFLLSCSIIVSLVTEGRCSQVHYIRGPQHLGCGPVPVHGLLGTGPRSRRWENKSHPHPPQSWEKLSSMTPVPGAKKGWGPLPYRLQNMLFSKVWESGWHQSSQEHHGTLERHRAVSSNSWRERIPSQTSPSR